MIRLLSLAFVVLMAQSASIVPFNPQIRTVVSGGGGGRAGDVLTEEFEGTGYDETVTGSWTETIGTGGSVNEDNASSPLAGSQDLLIYGGNAGQVSYTQFDTGSAKNEVFFRCRLQIDALPSIDLVAIMFRDAADVSRLVIYLRPSGLMKIECGGGTGNTVATYSAATMYYVWVHFKNDGTGSVAFNTTNSKPTSGNNFKAYTGGDTVALQTIRLRAEDQKTLHFDEVEWSTTDTL